MRVEIWKRFIHPSIPQQQILHFHLHFWQLHWIFHFIWTIKLILYCLFIVQLNTKKKHKKQYLNLLLCTYSKKFYRKRNFPSLTNCTRKNINGKNNSDFTWGNNNSYFLIIFKWFVLMNKKLPPLCSVFIIAI